MKRAGIIGMRWLVLAAAGTMLTHVALAQTQPGADQTEAERQRKLLEEQRRAAESADKALPSTENVTFADVLKDPDNIDLNFRYAKAQIARGNVLGAASTLERILLVTPDLAQVRLTYAIVLYRLDNIDEAEREFLALKKLQMAPSLAAEVDQFLAAIKQRRQKTKHRVQVSFGLKYDSNVNAAPRNGQVLVGGVPFTLVGRARNQHDFAALGIVSGDLRHDLGHQKRDEFLVSASYYQNEQFAVDSQDLQSGSASMGFRLPFDNFTVTPKLQYTSLRLSREKFFSGYGGEVTVERPNFLPELEIDGFMRGRVTVEKFHAITESATGPQRNGTRWEWSAGVSKQLNPRHRLAAVATFTRKLPVSDPFNDYRGHTIDLQHTWILGGGKFLLTSFDYSWDLYKTADPAVTPFQVRHDNRGRFRITYGMTLDKFITDATEGNPAAARYFDFLKGFTWTVTGEVLNQDSNIENFDYANRRVQTMLSRSWNF